MKYYKIKLFVLFVIIEIVNIIAFYLFIKHYNNPWENIKRTEKQLDNFFSKLRKNKLLVYNPKLKTEADFKLAKIQTSLVHFDNQRYIKQLMDIYCNYGPEPSGKPIAEMVIMSKNQETFEWYKKLVDKALDRKIDMAIIFYAPYVYSKKNKKLVPDLMKRIYKVFPETMMFEFYHFHCLDYLKNKNVRIKTLADFIKELDKQERKKK